MPVQEQVLRHPIAYRVLTEAKRNVNARQEEGDQAFYLGIGCSYGRHRSLALVENLAEQLRDMGHQVKIKHRDKDDKDNVFDGRRGGMGR